jgi:uncharacterized protein (TIGR03083 family)
MDEVSGYRAAKDFFVDALASTTPAARVPACPSWDVQDLVGHQVQQLRAACDGTFPVNDALDAIAATEPRAREAARARQEQWIADGLRTRRTMPLDAQVDEWAQLVTDAPAAALVGLFPDVSVHLFDLLGAAGSRAYRDHPVVVSSLRFWARQSSARMKQATGRPLRLRFIHTGDAGTIGDAGDAVSVEGSPFELVRAITGRRSRQQAHALRWEHSDDAAVEAFSVYGWRSEPLAE